MSLLSLAGRLPDSLEWGVLFRTHALAQFISNKQLVPMLGLPAGVDVAGSVAVALTSAGKCLDFGDHQPLRWVGDAPAASGGSIALRHARQLSLLSSAQQADCIGFGQLPGMAPVVLSVAVIADAALAEALFGSAPPQDHYDLLAAVGVCHLGGESCGPWWRARFRNRLGDHLRAAALSAFARTAHCNLFFLHHGRIDARLEAGLLAAAEARVAHGRGVATATAIALVLAARRTEMAMTCVPCLGLASYPFGDLVPLGLLAHALAGASWQGDAAHAATTLARRHLEHHQVQGLWPFHRGRLPTATDSALVLLGHADAAGVEALERFGDGTGGYLPQLVNAGGDALHMRDDAKLRHWCQADLGTTCLVRALRHRAGLPERTSLAWLEERFDRRAALFFANPYLTDWAFALAIAADPAAERLRDRLALEILASVNADFSFGQFDRPLSTALAILALAALGRHGRLLRIAQLRLLEDLEQQGRGPVTTPFHSTRRLPAEAADAAIRGAGVLRAGDEWHALSLYEDTHRMVLGAFALLALEVPCEAGRPVAAPDPAPHPRYRAARAARYVEAFVLPPYLDTMPGVGR